MAEVIPDGGRRAQRPFRRSPVLMPAAIAAATLVTWMVTVDRMQGMDAGPGTSLAGLGWFVGVWATMMAAMMLPSLMPTTLVFARVSGEHQRRGGSFVPTWVFIGGYLAAWTAYGLLAYGTFRAIQSAHIHALSWHAQGPGNRRWCDRRGRVVSAEPTEAQLPAALPLPDGLCPWRPAPGMVGRGADGVRARRVLHRVLLGANGDPVRARGDEHRVDAGGRRTDFRREGASVRRAALAGVRARFPARRDLGRRCTVERSRPDPTGERSGDPCNASDGHARHEERHGHADRKTHSIGMGKSTSMKMR